MARREPCIQSIKRGKYLIWEKRSPIYDFLSIERERERERERKVSFSDLQDFVVRNSSGQELKFITSMRATSKHQKGEISPNIQKMRFWGNQSFRVRRCFEAS